MKRALVIHDDEQIRNAIIVFLGKIGIQTQGAGNFHTGIQKLYDSKFDFVLIDDYVYGQGGSVPMTSISNATKAKIFIMVDLQPNQDSAGVSYLIKPINLPELRNNLLS